MEKARYILILLLALSFRASAQQDEFISSAELVVMGGGMNYIGDLNDQSMLGTVDWAAGIGIRNTINNRWAILGELNYGTIAAEKDYNILRNLSFKSHIYEVSAVVEFNFRPYGDGPSDGNWTPYIFGGLCLFHFNPQALYTDTNGISQWVDLQPLNTEGQGSAAYPSRTPYQLLQLGMPFGVGFKWQISKSFSLSAEYGFRKTWTDYIDDVSTTYVAFEDVNSVAAQMADRSWEVQEGYVNAPGIKRGDDSLDDWYSYFHISVGISLETLLGWTRSKRCKL